MKVRLVFINIMIASFAVDIYENSLILYLIKIKMH